MTYPTEIAAVVVAPSGNLGSTIPDHRSLHDQYRSAILSMSTQLDLVSIVTVNAQSASYTLVLADGTSMAVEMNVASANNLTVPPNSSVAFVTGTVIEVAQLGAGTTTLVAGAGVTINSRGALLNLAGQYAVASLRKRGTNLWLATGDLS